MLQGGVLRLDVVARPEPDTVTGFFLNRTLPFIRKADGGFYTLLGVDMETAPGVYQVVVKLHRSRHETETLRRSIRVQDAGFPVEKLTLDPAKVFPDSAALARIRRETALRNLKWSRWSSKVFWHGSFIPPVQGQMRRFGCRRIINGAPRSPHTGVDISAPEGTPVRSPAAGKVLLTGDFFFSGKSVYIDHGLGLVGMFFHLSRIDVAEGEMVEKGQIIGAVGSTGRASGAHLHWGVRWRGVRINPALLLQLEL